MADMSPVENFRIPSKVSQCWSTAVKLTQPTAHSYSQPVEPSSVGLTLLEFYCLEY